MSAVKRGVFTGAAAFGFLKAWNGNRKVNKALRRKRKGKPLSKEQERLIAGLKGREPEALMQGYKTYTGIVVAALGMVLGWMGIGGEEASTLSAQIVGSLDQIITVAGLLFAAYGRAKAKPSA